MQRLVRNSLQRVLQCVLARWCSCKRVEKLLHQKQREAAAAAAAEVIQAGVLGYSARRDTSLAMADQTNQAAIVLQAATRAAADRKAVGNAHVCHAAAVIQGVMKGHETRSAVDAEFGWFNVAMNSVRIDAPDWSDFISAVLQPGEHSSLCLIV